MLNSVPISSLWRLVFAVAGPGRPGLQRSSLRLSLVPLLWRVEPIPLACSLHKCFVQRNALWPLFLTLDSMSIHCLAFGSNCNTCQWGHSGVLCIWFRSIQNFTVVNYQPTCRHSAPGLISGRDLMETMTVLSLPLPEVLDLSWGHRRVST